MSEYSDFAAGEDAGSPPRIRILIADDHPMLREGVSAVIEMQPDMEIMGEAEDGEQAIARYQFVPAPVFEARNRVTAAVAARDPDGAVAIFGAPRGNVRQSPPGHVSVQGHCRKQ